MEAPWASNLNGLCWSILNDFGTLKRVKEYKTPFNMKAMSRFYILLMPILYGSFFVKIAYDSHAWVAILYLIFTVTAISCLFNILEALDNPFDEYGIDDLRITAESLLF